MKFFKSRLTSNAANISRVYSLLCKLYGSVSSKESELSVVSEVEIDESSSGEGAHLSRGPSWTSPSPKYENLTIIER